MLKQVQRHLKGTSFLVAHGEDAHKPPSLAVILAIGRNITENLLLPSAGSQQQVFCTFVNTNFISIYKLLSVLQQIFMLCHNS